MQEGIRWSRLASGSRRSHVHDVAQQPEGHLPQQAVSGVDAGGPLIDAGDDPDLGAQVAIFKGHLLAALEVFASRRGRLHRRRSRRCGVSGVALPWRRWLHRRIGQAPMPQRGLVLDQNLLVLHLDHPRQAHLAAVQVEVPHRLAEVQLPAVAASRIERVRAENVGEPVTFLSRWPKKKDLALRLSP